KDGKSEGAIGLELRMPKSTVHSIIVKYRLSNTVENLPQGMKCQSVKRSKEKNWKRCCRKEALRKKTIR
uniref:Uncharacterized protein n=1 Tax=Nothobranchius furzeri TaxID=105023 RepID=A0A8C6K8L6_NOTFU